MPFVYQVEFGHSQACGKGVYASEDIPAGATYWTLMPHPNQLPLKGLELRQNEVYTEQQFYALDEEKKIEVTSKSYFFSKGQVLIGLFDGSYYFNHDLNGPSLTVYDGDLSTMHSIVTRDVKKGEELTEDYSHWAVKECPWLQRIMKEYFPVRYAFEMEISKRSSEKGQRNSAINQIC